MYGIVCISYHSKLCACNKFILVMHVSISGVPHVFDDKTCAQDKFACVVLV